MIRHRISTVVVLLALAAPLASTAAAQTPAPALRESVTVTSDVVHIGDLVENSGPVADIPIFRSPDLGTTGAVTTERVVEAIRPHQLIDIDTRGLAEVMVTRLSRAITAQDITIRVAQVLSAQCGLGDARDIAVNFDHDLHTLQVEPDALGALQVRSLSCDPRTTRFDVTFDLSGSSELNRHPARYTGTAFESVATVAVDRPIEHGEVLKASDLTVLRRPKSESAGITDVAGAVGLEARHELRPGQPLHAADLMKPAIVQRNDTVTIVYRAPGLVLTLRGEAQEAGALGDSIGVLNAESKRVVQAVVSGPGRVTVNAVTTRIVENTPPSVMAPASSESSE
jgi:flagella basal body P-ring formation protein FlgA